MKTFGNKIKELRLKKELPARKVAAAIDIDQSSYSKLEGGTKKPTQKNIEALSKFYKVPLDDLVTAFVADRILHQLKDYNVGHEALKLAEDQLPYQTKNKKKK